MKLARPIKLLPLLMACALLAACGSTGLRDDATGELGAEQKESPADLYVKLAVEYLKDGQIETALQKIKKGLDLDKNNAQAHNVIALIYQKIGEHKRAEEHFQTALQLQPKDPYILNAWGSYLCDRKKYAAAEDQYNKALANPLYSTPWVVLTNTGICARRAGKTGKAEEYFRRALSANPRFGPALFRMAGMEYERGKYKSARTYLDRYFKVAPATPQTLLLGVRVERKLGSKKRSSTYAKMLKKRFPDAPEVNNIGRS